VIGLESFQVFHMSPSKGHLRFLKKGVAVSIRVVAINRVLYFALRQTIIFALGGERRSAEKNRQRGRSPPTTSWRCSIIALDSRRRLAFEFESNAPRMEILQCWCSLAA